MINFTEMITDNPTVKWAFLLFVAVTALAVCSAIWGNIQNKKQRQKVEVQVAEFANSGIELTLEEFMQMKDSSSQNISRADYAVKFDFAGIYIIFNKQRRKYYVGHSEEVIRAVEGQFQGYGNKEIYRDYQRECSFTVKAFSLKNSRFSSLNQQKSDYLKIHKNYAHLF